jgi:hypothetical protein
MRRSGVDRTWTKIERLLEYPYYAEVEVEIVRDELGWPAALPPESVEKVERVRAALKASDLPAALREAKVWEVKPVALDEQGE